MKYTVEMASDGMTDIRKGIRNFRNWCYNTAVVAARYNGR
jgi:hypothetical protein